MDRPAVWHIRHRSSSALSRANKWNETALSVNTFDSSEGRWAGKLFKTLKMLFPPRYTPKPAPRMASARIPLPGTPAPSLPVPGPSSSQLSRSLCFFITNWIWEKSLTFHFTWINGVEASDESPAQTMSELRRLSAGFQLVTPAKNLIFKVSSIDSLFKTHIFCKCGFLY